MLTMKNTVLVLLLKFKQTNITVGWKIKDVLDMDIPYKVGDGTKMLLGT